MLVRNVGHLMKNPAVKDQDGNEVPEGIMDAFFTSCISIHDIIGNGVYKNSKTKSIYIVKPKMHGPMKFNFHVICFQKLRRFLTYLKTQLRLGLWMKRGGLL